MQTVEAGILRRTGSRRREGLILFLNEGLAWMVRITLGTTENVAKLWLITAVCHQNAKVCKCIWMAVTCYW